MYFVRFQQRRNASVKLSEITVSSRTTRTSFKKFHITDFDLSDKPLGDDSTVKIISEQNPFLATSGIAKRLESAQQIISDNIRKLGEFSVRPITLYSIYLLDYGEIINQREKKVSPYVGQNLNKIS